MSETCGCCEGIEKLTPIKIANRPGLVSLVYRVGTHAKFFETMLTRLADLDLRENEDDPQLNPLLDLKTRALDDPSISFMDVWATVLDVLTFYQERIANEGFLHTAKERRSVLELANLVGYKLRPGVSATAYLAFTMEEGHTEEIPVGIGAQSVPGPGELPQSFETAEPLEARHAWNELKPRLRKPQFITLKGGEVRSNSEILTKTYFEGTGTDLKTNDKLLFIFGDGEDEQEILTVDSLETDDDGHFTKVVIEPETDNGSDNTRNAFQILRQLIAPLKRPPSLQPQISARLNRNRKQLFSNNTDIVPQLLVNQDNFLRQRLYSSWANTRIRQTPELESELKLESVHAFRIKAAPFGHNAPQQAILKEDTTGKFTEFKEWKLVLDTKKLNILSLNAPYEGIKPGSWVIVERLKNETTSGTSEADSPGFEIDRKILKVNNVLSVLETKYGMSARVTQLILEDNWIKEEELDPHPDGNKSLSSLRDVTIFAQSEPLELTDAPIENDLEKNSVELDRLYDGLKSGRWAIVSGERADIVSDDPEQGAVKASELVMISGVQQKFDETLPSDTPHTFLQFANNLEYKYKRDTVKIFGNVTRANHGETRDEILGSGDSSKALQEFQLRQSPLTYVSAATPSGIESTLELRVNAVQWHETDSLAGKKPDARLFETRTNNENQTSVHFGTGENGSRLPTGIENIKAVYRVGIGEAGNVAADQISMLVTKPLGVKEVINPLPATAGANREELSQARINAPIPLKALDRTVSVPDFADFARAFTGIGKADAVRLSDGRRELVHLTIAGVNDIPIDRSSDLFRNLQRALHLFGDPNQPLQVETRELKLIIISAQVKLLADFIWESVEPQIRATLLAAFGFENRRMGQDVLRSDVLSTVQGVPGVDYVDVDILDAIGDEIVDIIDALEDVSFIEVLSEKQPRDRIRVHKARVEFSSTEPTREIRPAQLAILPPQVSDTLILSEISA